MSTLKTPRNAVFSSLRAFFDEIDGEKQAADKTAANPLSEPGSRGGATSHPSKDVDDGLIHLQEGARFKENTSDVKEDIGAPSVENAGDPKGQMQYEMQIGVKHAPTGEDTSVERDFKGTKEDPGTSSVMKADDGEKYGSWDFRKLAAAIGNLGNELMADLGAGKLGEKRAADLGVSGAPGLGNANNGQSPKKPKPPFAPGGEEPNEEIKAAAAAGYKLAATLGLDEGGADAQVNAMVETIIKEAQESADGLAQFIDAYYRTVKRAADPAASDAEDNAPPGGPMPPDGGGGPMPPGAGDPSAGGDGGGGGAPPGGGQDPMEVLAQLPPEVLQQLVAAIQQGGLAGGGAGGPGGPAGAGGPPGGPGGPPGGPGGDPTENLSGAMHEMGVSPDDVAGAAPKVAADQRETLLKIAQAVKDRRRSGKLGYKVASTPYDQQVRAEMRQYLAEVIGT